jgi:hypothetical protein
MSHSGMKLRHVTKDLKPLVWAVIPYTINGNLSVLEVNSNRGLSSDDQTSTGSILHLMGWKYSDLVLRILTQTLQRYETKLALSRF